MRLRYLSRDGYHGFGFGLMLHGGECVCIIFLPDEDADGGLFNAICLPSVLVRKRVSGFPRNIEMKCTEWRN